MNWVVVLNRTKSEVYEYSPGYEMTLVKTLNNPLGRLKSTLMQKDRPGLSRGKYMAAAPHSLGATKDPHEEAAEQFVGRVAKELVRDLKRNSDLRVTLVAESRMLGKMRPYFDEATLAERMEWIEKDLVNIPQSKWPELIGLRGRSEVKGISNRFPV